MSFSLFCLTSLAASISLCFEPNCPASCILAREGIIPLSLFVDVIYDILIERIHQMDRSAERLSAVGVKPRIMSKPRVSSAVSARGVKRRRIQFSAGVK